MGEAYVDLQYRGLPLGERARISQFEAQHAYVDLPAPMPVGTAIALLVAGTEIAAQVVEIVEQTAGSERAPGMKVKAVLDAEAKRAWWKDASGNPAVLDVASALVEDAAVSAPPARVEIKPSTTEVMAVASPDASPDAPRPEKGEGKSPAPADLSPAVAPAPLPEEEKHAGATEVMPAMTEAAADAIVQPMSEEENTSVTSSAPVEAISDEPSGVIDPEAPEAPEAPSASDAAPRGRGKRKKPNRR